MMRILVVIILALSSASASQLPGGVLSVVAGDPVPEADITTSSIYLVPTDSLETETWDGTAWVTGSYGGQIEFDLSASAHLALNNYDLFETVQSGSVVLCSGPAWTNDITRSVAIENFQGRMVNAAAFICINGSSAYSVEARAANLRGGFRASANGQTKSTNSDRLVWDLLRPTWRPVLRIDTTTSWQWSAASFHQANASALNRIAVFNGASGRGVDITASGYMVGSTSTVQSGFVGIGIDVSNVDSSQTKNPCAGANVFPVLPCWARFAGYPGIGYHELRWLERGNGGAAQNWVGSNGYSGYGYQTGLTGYVLQ